MDGVGKSAAGHLEVLAKKHILSFYHFYLNSSQNIRHISFFPLKKQPKKVLKEVCLKSMK